MADGYRRAGNGEHANISTPRRVNDSSSHTLHHSRSRSPKLRSDSPSAATAIVTGLGLPSLRHSSHTPSSATTTNTSSSESPASSILRSARLRDLANTSSASACNSSGDEGENGDYESFPTGSASTSNLIGSRTSRYANDRRSMAADSASLYGETATGRTGSLASSSRAFPSSSPTTMPSVLGTTLPSLTSTSASGAASSSETTRTRTRHYTTPIQAGILTEELRKNPFPTSERRAELSELVGMSPRRVQVWFQNRRQAERMTRGRRPGDGSGGPSGATMPEALLPPLGPLVLPLSSSTGSTSYRPLRRSSSSSSMLPSSNPFASSSSLLPPLAPLPPLGRSLQRSTPSSLLQPRPSARLSSMDSSSSSGASSELGSGISTPLARNFAPNIPPSSSRYVSHSRTPSFLSTYGSDPLNYHDLGYGSSLPRPASPMFSNSLSGPSLSSSSNSRSRRPAGLDGSYSSSSNVAFPTAPIGSSSTSLRGDSFSHVPSGSAYSADSYASTSTLGTRRHRTSSVRLPPLRDALAQSRPGLPDTLNYPIPGLDYPDFGGSLYSSRGAGTPTGSRSRTVSFAMPSTSRSSIYDDTSGLGTGLSLGLGDLSTTRSRLNSTVMQYSPPLVSASYDLPDFSSSARSRTRSSMHTSPPLPSTSSMQYSPPRRSQGTSSHHRYSSSLFGAHEWDVSSSTGRPTGSGGYDHGDEDGYRVPRTPRMSMDLSSRPMSPTFPPSR